MTWDAENRITSVGGASYLYDATGNRVEKQGVGVTDTVYFGGRPIARLSAGQWTDLIYGPTGLLAEVPGTPTGAPVYRVTDHLGSTVGSLLADGTFVNPVDYTPFGQVFTGSTSDPYLFTGYERDSESGLDYASARHYASYMGRFMSPDPSGLAASDMANPQSLNLYAYSQNSPLTKIDPSGLDCVYANGFGDSDTETGGCNPSMAWGLAQQWGGQGGAGLFGSFASNAAGTAGSLTGTSVGYGYFDGTVNSVDFSGLNSWGDVAYAIGFTPDSGASIGSGLLENTQQVSSLEFGVENGSLSGVTGSIPAATWVWAATQNTRVHGLWTYGNWAGSGGSGVPLNNTDAQGMIHDRCYAMNGNADFTTSYRGSNPSIQACNQQLCDGVRSTAQSSTDPDERAHDWDIVHYFSNPFMRSNRCHK